ncbi:MAG TPA: porin family protein [Flavobacteriaceae bacterium]|nr:porin family protein [Flavobacteriaceae bacterium]
MGGTIESNFEMKMKLNYINIPIMAKYYVAEGFSLVAGPQLGFLMSAKADADVSVKGNIGGMTIEESSSETVDIKDQFSGFDLSFGVGAAYRLDMGVFFGARYNLGLTNISKENDESSKNGVIQVSVGYSF